MNKVTLINGTTNEVGKGSLRRLRKKIRTLDDLPAIQEKTGYDTETMTRIAFWMDHVEVRAKLEGTIAPAPVADEKVYAEVNDELDPSGEMTYELAEQIRSDYANGMRPKDLQEKYGRAASTLRDIYKGRTWIAKAA